MSIIFIFLDGVGIAPTSDDNPLSSATMPVLQSLLAGPLTLEQTQDTVRTLSTTDWRALHGQSQTAPSPSLLYKAIDATLGVEGLPQSGTGHVALFAGVNAAAMHGHHQPHFPPVAQRPLLAERNILRRMVDHGRLATFANPFGPSYWHAVAARRIRRSASVIAAEGAGLRFRDSVDLAAGHAVSWDVTNAAMREREPSINIPLVTPTQAGYHLARLANDHDLVFYESFLPDLAGHGRLAIDVPTAMELLDGLIGGVLAMLRDSDTLLITSDHGNIESIAAPAHTRNAVPLLVVGPAAPYFAHITSIMDVADAIERAIVGR